MIENNEKQGSSQKIYLLYIPYSCQSHIPQQKARDSTRYQYVNPGKNI